jgi:outer membrane receptor protein involved in Fe transport
MMTGQNIGSGCIVDCHMRLVYAQGVKFFTPNLDLVLSLRYDDAKVEIAL